MQNISKAVIGVLVLVALGLGLAIYNQKNPSQPSNTPPPPPSNQQSNPIQLTPEQEKLFNPPGANASETEKREHYDLALQMSTESNKIDINNCVATPVVTRVRLNSTFTVTNSGDKEIEFGFDKKVKIAAGGSAQVKADFKNGVGVYGYGCPNTDVTRLIGYIMVMPES